MRKYNPNVPNPSCKGTKKGETPVYDGDEVRIYNLCNNPMNFKAERMIMIHARIKNGETLEGMNLYPDQLAAWKECCETLGI